MTGPGPRSASLRRRGLLAAGLTLGLVAAAVGLGVRPDATVAPINDPARPGGQVGQPTAGDPGNPGSGAASGPRVTTMSAGRSNVDVRRLPQLPASVRPDRDAIEEHHGPRPSLEGGETFAEVGSGAGPQAAPAPNPSITFEGLSFNGDCNGSKCGAGHPPDTNGDVGPTYYIQSINTAVGIYDKATGVRVAAFTFDALMSQGAFGNLCPQAGRTCSPPST